MTEKGGLTLNSSLRKRRKRIGIVPSATLFETEDPYRDQYHFVNNYGKRIMDNGGVPVGILPVDGEICEESLELCDGFLICGGRRIHPYHFQLTGYAVAHEKPLLGVCLGMQTIGTWFKVREEAKRRGYTGDLLQLYEQMKKERVMFTLPVEHHWDVQPRRGHMDEAKHEVLLSKDSYLSELLQCHSVRGVTLHHYQLNEAPAELAVSARTKDGTIEGIEKGHRILGVQFHPEADESLDRLFRGFFSL